MSHLRGLENLGNTCYLNTTLQCLSHTMSLTEFILTNKKQRVKANKQAVLLARYQQLLRELWGNDNRNRVVRPENYVHDSNLVSIHMHKEKGTSIFRPNEQNDMAEYLQFFLETIHDSISSSVNMYIEGHPRNRIDQLMIESLRSWERFFAKDYSIIVDMFTGQYISQIMTVDAIGPIEHSETFDPFNILTLPIPPRKQRVTLYDCFQEFMTPEEIDGWIGTAMPETGRKIEKKVSLWKLPNILIIQLKRFTNQFSKNNAFVDFQLQINLESYCLGYDRSNANYVLYAVGHHTGTLNGGHYFATCKNNGKWYLFNDSHVSEIPVSQVFSPSAYCLFYYKVQNNTER